MKLMQLITKLRFRMFLLAAAVAIYLLATGVSDWRLWIPLCFIIVERCVSQAIAYFVAVVMQKQIAGALEQMFNQANQQPPKGDMGGGLRPRPIQ